MKNIKVLITAGPTREAIDPVRFITNKSTGKMGYALAEDAAKRRATVVLISGPCEIPVPVGVSVINVLTADEMYNEVMKRYEKFDVIIMAAAVVDYKCSEISKNKIKKSDNETEIKLVKNKDIAYEISKNKGMRIHVGFCAETENLETNAIEKLKNKKFDLIAANDITKEGAGFATDTNIIKLIGRDLNVKDLPLMSKQKVAKIIIDEISNLLSVPKDNR